MARRKKLTDMLRQNNTRGMGLARDVQAGQARERPRVYIRRDKARARGKI